MINITKPLVLTFAIGAVALGCADDEQVPDIETVCDEPDKSDCKHGDGESNDEVGDGDGDEADAGDGDGDEYRYCIATPGNGVRAVHQCNGHLTASIEFKVGKKDCAELLGGEDQCSESHSFGVGEDPYDMPAVMACCDAEGTPEEDALEYCAADLVGQVCSSISKRIEVLIKGIDDLPDLPGLVKDAMKKQAKNLLWHVNTHQQDCFDALHKPGGPGVIGPVEWKIANDKGWAALEDFTVKLDKAVVESTSLPDDGSMPIACEDNGLNDDEVFEERGPLSPPVDVDVYRLSDSASVPIMGPRLPDGGSVGGSAEVASQSVCTQPLCSRLEFGNSDANLVLEDLNLYAHGVASISMGEMSLDVERLALRLYGAVPAHPYHGNDGNAYVIDPGAARFLVSGAVGDMTGTRWAENSSPIRVHASDEGCTIEGFTVVHTDGVGGVWNASIPLTTWD